MGFPLERIQRVLMTSFEISIGQRNRRNSVVEVEHESRGEVVITQFLDSIK